MTKYGGIDGIKGTIRLTVNRENQEMLQLVLKPELAQRVSRRSVMKADSVDSGLLIRIKGRDLSSFRASITSIFRLLHVVIEIQRILSRES